MTLLLLLAMPGGIVVATLFDLGFLAVDDAVAAAAALLALAALAAVMVLASLSSARSEIEALGPDRPNIEPVRPRSLVAQTLWPAMLRLRRTWRDHAAELEVRLGAAEAIIEAAPDPLILIDRQRRIVRSNAASLEFIEPGAERRDLAAALRNPALLAAADAVLRGGPATSVEFTVALPVERMLRARFARIDSRSADGAAAILTLHDVTALKRAEQMRADFVANAGHELKTPLAVLSGFIETLLGPARDDAVARERFLGIMREQSARMARLVDDLLSLSRIELNEHVAPTSRVAVGPLVEEVARGLELRAAERGIHIACDIPDVLPEVQGDRHELAQILQNLLDNAVKYGRPATEVTVTAGAGAAGTVWIAVADRGEGIASEHLPRLTERFYRVDTARSRELGGTGLGLAIVKHILNRHRGRLDIASRMGEGSTFTVWLRAAEPPGAVDGASDGGD